MKTIDRYCGSRDNNFNLLRFLAAFSVVASHAAVVVGGPDAPEPLMASTGYTLGHHAVNVFFIISGFLIAQSYVRSGSLSDYLLARGLRLIPGLTAAAFVTAFVLGPLVTGVSLGEYFSALSTWTYVPLTGSMLVDDETLTGVFSGVPSADIVNVPLWTLRWELIAYIGLAGLGLLQILSSKTRFGAILILFLGLYVAVTLLTNLRSEIAAADHAMRFGLCFLAGTAAFVYREKLPLSLPAAVALWIVPVLLRNTEFYQVGLVIAVGYSTLWLAFVPGGVLRKFNDWGDFSYGIYIYGFPIKQTLILFLPMLTAPALFALSVPIILLAGALSFYLVERPAMRLRRKRIGPTPKLASAVSA